MNDNAYASPAPIPERALPPSPAATPAVAPAAAPVVNRRARVVLVDRSRGVFLAQVNNRASPGGLTLMLPGGGLEGDESARAALERECREELGVTLDLGPDRCRFLMTRTYEFPGKAGSMVPEEVRLDFYVADVCDLVPRNMEPESVISVSWMRLEDVRRLVKLDGSGWKVPLGVLDALEMALDPVRNGAVQGGGREVSRRDGGQEPDTVFKKPVALPYGC